MNAQISYCFIEFLSWFIYSEDVGKQRRKNLGCGKISGKNSYSSKRKTKKAMLSSLSMLPFNLQKHSLIQVLCHLHFMQRETVPDTAKSSISFILHKHSAKSVPSFLQIIAMNSETLSDMFKFLQVE